VHQGYFDILFPTNFDVAKEMYENITHNFARVYTHEEFMLGRANLDETLTQNGESPLLSWYKNASVMITVQGGPKMLEKKPWYNQNLV